MSVAAACGWTLVRSVAIVLVSLPLCWWIREVLAGLTGGRRTLLWGLLLVPFFTPALLTGYSYANFSLSLIRHPAWNEALYGGLIMLRFLPVAVLVMVHAPPPPVSAEALHCARLALSPEIGPLSRMRRLFPFYIRGPWRAAFPAAAVLFLLCFQEFEVASLMSIESWTVKLFDAQVGGVMLTRLMRLLVLPCLCQLVILGPLVLLATPGQFLPANPHEQLVSVRRWKPASVWLVSLLGIVLVTLVPLMIVGCGAMTGMASVLENGQMLREILRAGGFGVAAGVLSAVLAYWILRLIMSDRRKGVHRCAGWCALAFSLPGLMGSLAVSLIFLSLLQWGPLIPVRDTVLPAVLAMTVFLWPRALWLLLLAEVASPPSSLHLTRLLGQAPHASARARAAELHWQLRLRHRFLAAGVLCLWGYLELTPCYLLAPPGMATAPGRLYNLMHYGRSDVLSAMVLLTMLAPVVLLGLLAILKRIWLKTLA